MGQFAAKIKQLAERLELNNDKRSPARLSKSLLEISNKQTSTSDLSIEEEQCAKETKTLLEVMGKLELIETVVENQRQIMGDQEAKLRALENTVRNAQMALEKVKEQACEDEVLVSDVEASKESPFGQLFDSIFQDKAKSDEEDQEDIMKRHEETLENHEQRLQAAIDKIQMIWERITQDNESSSMLDAQQEELKELKKLVETLRQNHDALKKESFSELETKEKILDNMFAGFVVAFFLLVFICMFYK